MTSRSTNSSGVAIGTHVEADPMGGNAGIETLYVEEPPEPPSPAPDFPAFSVTEIDPPYVNGQRVSMSLDGMNVPYSVGMSLLGFSADVGCSQIGQVYTNPEPGQGGRIYGINMNCEDRMTLALNGIFLLDRFDQRDGSRQGLYDYALIVSLPLQQGGARRDLFPGFKKEKLATIEKALNRAKKLIEDENCLKGLAEAGIDVEELVKVVGTLRARPDSAKSSTGYNIFDAEKSGHKQIRDYLKTDRSRGSGAFMWGDDIMIQKQFFNARGSARIGGEVSRAIALIHEAVHITGKDDDFFDGSAKLNDIILKACYSKLYGHNDLAIVGN